MGKGRLSLLNECHPFLFLYRPDTDTEYCRRTYASDKKMLLSEIKKNKPDVVLIDLNLYAKTDGIETTRKIRSQFDIPVWYKC